MLAAATVLEESDPGRADPGRAMVSEKAALVALIRARDTIRQVVSRSPSTASASARDFSRRQHQKLRMPSEEASDRTGADDILERLRSLRDRQAAVQAGVSKGDGQLEALEKDQRGIFEDSIQARNRMQRLSQASELARKRMDDAVARAEGCLGALGRGNREQAIEESREAAAHFRELAKHLDALVAEETGRIALARDRASELATCQRCLSGSCPAPAAGLQRTPPAPDGATGPRGPARSAGLADSASRIARGAETLEDILGSFGAPRTPGGGTPRDDDLMRDLAREAQVPGLVRRLQEQELLASSGGLDPNVPEVRQSAERLEALAGKLDELYRSIAAPDLQKLLDLEARAVRLRAEAEALSSPAAISAWHRAADLFSQDMQVRLPGSASAARLLEAMREQGWAGRPDLDWRWEREGAASFYALPTTYATSLRVVVEEIHGQIREALLRDTVTSSDEPTPAQYRDLVERYFQALSEDAVIE